MHLPNEIQRQNRRNVKRIAIRSTENVACLFFVCFPITFRMILKYGFVGFCHSIKNIMRFVWRKKWNVWMIWDPNMDSIIIRRPKCYNKHDTFRIQSKYQFKPHNWIKTACVQQIVLSQMTSATNKISSNHRLIFAKANHVYLFTTEQR